MGSTKYITSNGELNRKDNSLCFRKNGKNIYIPVTDISEIYCLNEVSLNSKLLDFLSKNSIVVHFFNYYEGYSGTFYPKDKFLSGRLLVSQVNAYSEKRTVIAKSIVRGIAFNILDTLTHYKKHGKSGVSDIISWINNDFKTSLDSALSINDVMLVEAELWQRFYSSFKEFLPEEWIMNKRVKRPPDNPINALISFGNSILYAKTISTIYKTHLDQRISFLHEPSEGRFSLSLDISEVFKPVVVYKTIFDLINRKQLNIDKHFEKKLNYCVLNDQGKSIFIEALEDRLNSLFEHNKLKRKISYKTAMKLDCYKLIKCILEDAEFTPFRLKDKM